MKDICDKLKDQICFQLFNNNINGEKSSWLLV